MQTPGAEHAERPASNLLWRSMTMPEKGTCSLDGCFRPHKARGLCDPHYRRWLATGDVGTGPIHDLLHWPENLLQRMEPQPNGCIYFTGYINRLGYGAVSRKSRPLLAHRAAYELFVGPILDGLHVDHECHNRDESCAGGPSCLHRRCVNEDHLALVTLVENVMSGSGITAVNSRKTHCIHGHEFSEENTRIDSSGWRRCRACVRARTRRYHQARKELTHAV